MAHQFFTVLFQLSFIFSSSYCNACCWRNFRLPKTHGYSTNNDTDD
ncbi:hypothetical protein [Citrobacter freundii]|uniref:Uncharacterized protein n=1 Tax=Citrobacter freundii TaxID=546 RepID=A0A7G2IM03_CITFR|nr:hypothetical protein [Citrobacter freundii]